MTFLKWIKSLFASQSGQERLDDFVSSKNPTSVGEVDYWIRYYDTKISKGATL